MLAGGERPGHVWKAESGRDSMYGGDGQDTLTGGAGNDLLVGGPGDDTLDCGAGPATSRSPGSDDVVRGCETVER